MRSQSDGVFQGKDSRDDGWRGTQLYATWSLDPSTLALHIKPFTSLLFHSSLKP